MSSSSSTTRLFASCTRGLEYLLKWELETLGITDVETGSSGVYLPYSIENVYRVNYCSRTAMRLLFPLAQFACNSREQLYKATHSINWSQFLTPEKTFAVDANVWDTPGFTNSHFAALVVKDAVCDHIRQHFNDRPQIDVKHPNLQLNLYLSKGKASLSLDTSGAPLFKRGWRVQTTEAPLQETLAASILLQSGFKPGEILFDPFCGSGTFLVEAAMIASRTPAGFYRKQWGFSCLPEHTEEAWTRFKTEQNAKRISLPPNSLFGSDRDQEALDRAYENLSRAGFDTSAVLIARDIKMLKYPAKPTLIVTNPPYGIRLEQDTQALQAFYGWAKKQNAPAFLIYPEEAPFALPHKRLLTFYNGGIKINLTNLL